MVRLLHVSDTHLGYKQYGLVERAEDTYEAFREVAEIAKEYRVDAVLHGGDMFHSSSPPPMAYKRAIDVLKDLKEKNIPLYISPGNHELPRSMGVGSPIKVLEEIGLLKSPPDYRRPHVFELGKVSLHVFTDWSADELFKMTPRSGVSVALSHVALCDPAPMKEIDACKRGYTARNLQRGYSYVALGHYHTAWQTEVEGMIVAYSGSTEFFSVEEARESEQKSVNLVEISGDGVASVTRIPLRSPRPWIIATGSKEEVLKRLSQLGAASKPYLLYVAAKIALEVERSEIKRKLDELINKGAALHYNLVTETPREKRREERVEAISADNVIESIIMDKEIASLVISFFRDQLDVKRLKSELAKSDRAEKIEKLARRWQS